LEQAFVLFSFYTAIAGDSAVACHLFSFAVVDISVFSACG
jgi:hypothetical protein